MNDQHGYLDVPANSPLKVGDLVGFGINHPCTTFDKWQVIHVVDETAVDEALAVAPLVDALLAAEGIARGDLHGIAFGSGPGAFTGLRVACGVAQGIAFGGPEKNNLYLAGAGGIVKIPLLAKGFAGRAK